MRFVVATYNVHAGVGLDRRYDAARIARVIAAMDAHVVALQEATMGSPHHLLETLREATGMQSIACPTFARGDGHFGNALLTRCPVVSSSRIDLSVARREPRQAIDAVIDANGTHVRIVATHLGLRAAERAEQIDRLLRELEFDTTMPTILLGDINEGWIPRAAMRRLQTFFRFVRPLATYPSLLPLFPLDRIWVKPASALAELSVVSTDGARMASDHLPLRAQLEIPVPERGHTG